MAVEILRRVAGQAELLPAPLIEQRRTHGAPAALPSHPDVSPDALERLGLVFVGGVIGFFATLAPTVLQRWWSRDDAKREFRRTVLDNTMKRLDVITSAYSWFLLQPPTPEAAARLRDQLQQAEAETYYFDVASIGDDAACRQLLDATDDVKSYIVRVTTDPGFAGVAEADKLGRRLSDSIEAVAGVARRRREELA